MRGPAGPRVCWLPTSSGSPAICQKSGGGRRSAEQSCGVSSSAITGARLRCLAQLAAGWECYLDFATAMGAITPTERAEWWARGRAALETMSARQGDHQAESEPAQRWLELLTAAIVSGDAHVARIDGLPPVPPTAWGWRERDAGHPATVEPLGRRIGWLEGDDLYLQPDAAFAVAQTVGERVGDPIRVQPKTLHKRLREQGLLRSVDTARGKTTVRRTCEGKRIDCLHLAAVSMIGSAQEAQPAQQ